MKKLLPIIGLLLLVSCGQSLDTTSHTDGDEEITTETNYNRIEDIQDCLNGDREACTRAINEGFSNAPLFYEDLETSASIEVEGILYERVETTDEFVRYSNFKTVYNYNGGTYHANLRVDIVVYPDYSLDVKSYWKYNFWTNYELLVVEPGTSQVFLNHFTHLPESNLEWSSQDSKKIHVELLGNVKVYKR